MQRIELEERAVRTTVALALAVRVKFTFHFHLFSVGEGERQCCKSTVLLYCCVGECCFRAAERWQYFLLYLRA